MFRITCDFDMNMFYVHKKFCKIWIKWSFIKTNYSTSLNGIKYIMENGRYDFNGGENSNYYYITDVHNDCDIKVYYVKDADDFTHQLAEYLI